MKLTKKIALLLTTIFFFTVNISNCGASEINEDKIQDTFRTELHIFGWYPLKDGAVRL